MTYTQPLGQFFEYCSIDDTQKPIKLSDMDCIIRPQVSLAKYSTYKVGGEAQWYVEPKNYHAIDATFEWFAKQDLPLTFLGAGSNLLISDAGIPGLVLNTRNLKHCSFEAHTGQITAAAGVPIANLANEAAKRGWRGLEWAIGIPGTVGGAVVMNAGAHQNCLADVLVSATILTPEGDIEIVTPEDLNYSYRTSCLQGSKRLVIEATLQLQTGFSKAEVMELTKQNRQQRIQSQPYDKPSCGSVFRNPTPYKAGRLIEEIGLKGFQIGGAQVALKHANFILNWDNATADDIYRVIRYVQEQVEYRWSISLKPEVKLLGKFNP